MPIASRQLLNFLIFSSVERGTLNLHRPPNAVLVAEFHQRWWFSAKQRDHIALQIRLYNAAVTKLAREAPCLGLLG